MIDLKELEAKFEKLFQEQTEESFLKWLEDDKQRGEKEKKDIDVG